MKYKGGWLLLVVLTVLLNEGCKHEPFPPTNITLVRQMRECDPDSVYFEKDIQPLLQATCVAGCHDEATANEGVVLSSFNRIRATTDLVPGDPGESDIYEMITEVDIDDRMPPAPAAAMSAENIALIKKWIEQGARNNTCNFDTVPKVCNPLDVSYSSEIVSILQSNGCLTCHSGANNVLLNSYADVKARVDDGRLIGAVTHAPGFEPMPQGGGKIDSCDIATIQTWIDEGAPNN